MSRGSCGADCKKTKKLASLQAGISSPTLFCSRILQIIRGIPQMCSSGTSYEPQPDEEQSTMGYPKMMSSSTSTYTCSVGVGTSTYISTSVQVRTRNQAWAKILNYLQPTYNLRHLFVDNFFWIKFTPLNYMYYICMFMILAGFAHACQKP